MWLPCIKETMMMMMIIIIIIPFGGNTVLLLNVEFVLLICNEPQNIQLMKFR